MPRQFHRTPEGIIHIDDGNIQYEDTAANLESDSGGLYTDAINYEYQKWSEGKICAIINGIQQVLPPADAAYQDYVDAVLADLQTIVDAKIDREALANPEVQLSLNPTSIVADGAVTTTLTVQLLSGLKHDASRENILQADVPVQVRVTEPHGTQIFNFVTDANGQASDTYDAIEIGTYIFETISHPSVNTPELTAT